MTADEIEELIRQRIGLHAASIGDWKPLKHGWTVPTSWGRLKVYTKNTRLCVRTQADAYMKGDKRRCFHVQSQYGHIQGTIPDLYEWAIDCSYVELNNAVHREKIRLHIDDQFCPFIELIRSPHHVLQFLAEHPVAADYYEATWERFASMVRD